MSFVREPARQVDQIALARGKVMMTDSGVNRRVTNMLLDWLGQRNRKSFLVGCTNFLESMDLAFLRAGRVDEVCLVLPPDATARKEILELHCTKVRKIPVEAKLNYQQIADKTFMWTGAELEKLALDASRLAMEATATKVTMKHFEDAMERVEVNVKQRSETIQGMVATMRKMENVSKAFLDESLKEFAHGEKDRSRVKSFIENL